MYRFALPKGPVRSACRGSPAARSIRLALRTSSIVATSSASFVRWVLRWFGRRRLSSELMLSAISVGSSWVSGWWTFGRDEVRVDWLRGDLSIDPGASHVLVIPGDPLVADRRREMLRAGAPASVARG